jgi:Tfp pilus assembly protein PilV
VPIYFDRRRGTAAQLEIDRMRQKTIPRRGGKERGLRARGGFSIVETIVALVLLGVGLLGVVSVGTTMTRQLGRARSDLQLWAGLQTVADSLAALSVGSATASSRSIAGYSFAWTVDTTNAGYSKVSLRGGSTGTFAVADSMIIWLR